MESHIEYQDRLLNKDPIASDQQLEASQGQVALDELTRILQAMGIKAQVFYQEKETEILLEIKGTNLGLVIGKRGQTLEALEFILNLIHRKKFENFKELVVDAEGYREKKMDILRKILFSARDTVLNTHDEVPLEPMAQSDRKIIHLLCRDLGDIISESRGEGQNRRVVLKPIEDSLDFGKAETVH